MAREWDYSLHIGGVTHESLGMARLAEYIARFAELLGSEARPVFAGTVRGSVVVRARDRNEIPALTRARMRDAATNDETPARAPYQRIAQLLLADGARGKVLDRANATVIEFPRQRPAATLAREYTVNDVAEVDGVVVGVEGVDDTAHLRLLDQATGKTTNINVRDMNLAREAAAQFRGMIIRVRVHGTWRRDADGQWLPQMLYADGIEQLDQSDALTSFRALRAIPGNGWAQMPAQEADTLCAELRGSD
jgi:hypothetical protein